MADSKFYVMCTQCGHGGVFNFKPRFCCECGEKFTDKEVSESQPSESIVDSQIHSGVIPSNNSNSQLIYTSSGVVHNKQLISNNGQVSIQSPDLLNKQNLPTTSTPVANIEMLARDAQALLKYVPVPVSNIQIPASNAQTLDTNAQTSASSAYHTSTTGPLTVVSIFQTPLSIAKILDTSAMTPLTSTQIPTSFEITITTSQTPVTYFKGLVTSSQNSATSFCTPITNANVQVYDTHIPFTTSTKLLATNASEVPLISDPFVRSSVTSTQTLVTGTQALVINTQGAVTSNVAPTTSTQPVTSTEAPTTSTQPVTSNVAPTTSTQPFTSTEAPTTSTQPVTSNVAPTTSTQPVTSNVAPTTSTQPVTSNVAPTTSTQPVTSNVAPTTSTQAVTSTEAPTTSTQPVTSTEAPTTSTQPVTSNVAPTTSTQPFTSTEAPTTSTQPVTSNVAPTTSTQPVTSNVAPTTSTQPVTSNVAPTTSTQPVTSTEAPTTSTQPVTSTEAPTTSTQPVTSNVAPTTSTQPVTSTEAPTTSTQPVTSTVPPVTSTQASITSTVAPVTSAQAPVTSTVAPVTSTQPFTGTQAPGINNQALGINNQAPVTSTLASVTSTRTPVTTSPVTTSGQTSNVSDEQGTKNSPILPGQPDNRMGGRELKRKDDGDENINQMQINKDSTTPKKSCFDPSKLRGPTTTIEFHVLLSKEEWLWDDTAKVYIRFGDHRLGGFDCSHGPMEIYKEYAEYDIIELVHTVKVPVALFGLPYCPYKYCVLSKTVKEFMKTPYEFIHGHDWSHSGKVIDRSLRLPNWSFIIKDRVYVKFDGLMYPQLHPDKLKQLQSKEGSKHSIWDSFTGLFFKFKNLFIPSREGETKYLPTFALRIYLSKHQKCLAGKVCTSESPIEVITDIVYIVNSLCKTYLHIDSSSQLLPNRSDIQKEMVVWLKQVIEELQNYDGTFNILQSVMILLMVICRLDLDLKFLEENHYQVLFKGLCRIPEFADTNSWPHLVAIRESLLKEDKLKSEFIQFLKKIQRKSCQLKKPLIELIFSFPMLHFAQGVWSPFKRIESLINFESSRRAALNYFKDITANCFPLPEKFFDDNPFLFAADPFLLLLCVLASPMNEYGKLISKVPLFMLITAMIDKVDSSNANKELDILQLFIEAANTLEYASESRVGLIIAVKSALQLVVKGRDKYSNLNNHLCSMIELFLSLREKCFVVHNDDEIASLMHQNWNLYSFIESLIQALLPIKSFGGINKLFSKEITIWTTLNEVNCPKSFEIEWHNVMEEVIQQRISKMDSDLMKLLFTIDPDTTPEFVTGIILTYVLKNFDNIKDMNLEDPSWLQRMISSPTRYGHEVSNRILDILSKFLNKRYPKTEDITENELLDWKMWPSFFKMIAKNLKLEEDDHYTAIVAALSQLHILCEKICSRSITFKSLSNIRNKEAQFKKLCDTASSDDRDMYMMFSQVKPHLDECYYIQSQFVDYRNQISTLLEFCNSISYGSLTKKLKQELNNDYYDIPLKELIEPVTGSNDYQLVSQFFSTENVPIKLLQYLYIVGKQYPNDIFESCWRQQCKSCVDLDTFQKVYEVVCIPVLTECKEVLVSLHQRTMTLENVMVYFLKFEPDELKNHLQHLCEGMRECFPSDKQLVAPSSWVPGVVATIQVYKKMKRDITTAMIVLKLKDSMKLTGDFAAVDTIVQLMRPNFKKQPLSVINKELLTVGEVLTEISAFPQRCNCLEVFSKSTKLIHWLKSETGSVGAVANFVEVATSTTGEGDYHLDKLSLLHSVATGYSSLIFDVDHKIGFIELFNKCHSLWRALEENPQLPEYLIRCKEDLDLYIEIKNIQGPVEVTSMNQVVDINQHGAYTIHCNERKQLQSIENGVSLQIARVEAAKKNYSFNDLRDLESKLALIRGKSTKNAPEIDRFLTIFHLVCRIAGNLQQLQHTGHTKYISWSLTFTCSKISIEALINQAGSMEAEVNSTLGLINEQRHKFHALNYFTMQQLLQIRCELGILKQNKSAEVTPQLLSLLACFSLQITAYDIKNIIEEVYTSFSEHSICMKEENEVVKVQSPTISEDKIVEGTCDATQKESQLADGELVEKGHKDLGKLIQELNNDEEEIFVQLLDLRYSKVVCYNAVKHAFLSAENASIDDILNIAMDWCFDNANQYKNDNINNEETMPDQDGPVEAKKTAMTEENITISHNAVQKLLELGFSPELSLKGAKLCNGDFDQASEWCLNAEISNNEMERPLFASLEDNTSIFSSEEIVEAVSFKWKEIWNEESVNKYMDIVETATVLEQIHKKFAGLPSARFFPDKILHVGETNLLVVTPGELFKTVLSLYMKDSALPLPSSAEVCICSSTTTAEEVELLWHRAMKDPDYQNIYCLVHAERLSYQVCEAAFKKYDSLSQGNNEYRIVIICSLEDEESAHVVSKLHQYRREYPPLPRTTEIASYLKKHFINKVDDSAALVDPEMSSVRVVVSNVSGMGKSLYIERLAEKLQKQCQVESQHVIIPIHGPVVNADTVMMSLCNHIIGNAPIAQIIHFDIASSVLSNIDTLLFSLLILKSLTDSRGQIWHCLPLQYYAIELTCTDVEMLHQKGFSSTMSILEVLPTVKCPGPLETLQKYKLQQTDVTMVLMDEEIFKSTPLQRVYQYLKSKNSTNIKYVPGSVVEKNKPVVLSLLLKHCGVRNPSWAELQNFVKFLNIQLYDCEESVYCNENIPVVRDVLQGFKPFVVKFMIRMSRDFATPSLKAAVLQVDNEDIDDTQQDITEQYQIIERKAWETSFHPYIFFNYDRASLTFLGFKITPNGDLVDPVTDRMIEHQLLTKELRKGLTDQKVNFNENYFAWDRCTMIRKLCTMMGFDMSDPDDTYVLTIDNVTKILAIQMRFRCNIPVVIMGETGCGKTRLIRYMCDLQSWGSGGYKTMLMMKVHGGITERDIEKKVNEAIELAKENKEANPPVDTVLFFDEANTTEAIGLIKEIMCDRRLNGKPLLEDIKFIAACNPYRKHSKEMIQRLEKAGLGFYVQSTKTVHKLGSIPLRQLVYRVLALPPSMQPLVYDFGQLTNNTEKDYTTQIVTDRVKKNTKLNSHPNCDQITVSLSHVFAASQVYMRERKDECSFVSLRDVERAMIVFEWFYDKNEIIFKQLENELIQFKNYKPLDPVVRSLIMAVAVCYHARLQQRYQFEEVIVKYFKPPYHIPGGREQFVEEIFMCQSMFLRQMKLGPNIASNAALRENVFMMVVCVELRIPLFLVGKPGSSKSLAKSIVADSMQGRTSHSTFLKELKQVKMFSYQCSQLSTPQSILELFGTADKFQKSKEKDIVDTKDTGSRFVSVVVLDEVGLAEDSPSLPLKALHPLLEDGTSGADSKIIDREKRVAFIGISNWALDPAKMNRGVMVTRGKPDEEELILSARGICSMEKDDKYRDRLEKYFKLLASSYLEICEKQQPKEFFGLRDFYSLIKMLYWMIKKTNQPLTMGQLEHAVKRNFGGLDEVDAVGIFQKNIHIADGSVNVQDPKIFENMYPDCSAMGLIKTSLATKETSLHGESRYLLFLTENYAALSILQQDLLFHAENPPFVLFGSSFPKDREYTQVCRNINQIKICMETGRSVILLNLENLYESLYDVLNQYYTLLPGKRYVDLGLQTHRIKCRVHDDFKLILIAERDKVYEEFPTPLINRLEKHFVVTATVLNEIQKQLVKELEDWVKKYACIRGFKVGDAFVGYQKDTPAAVVFQVSHILKDYEDNVEYWKAKALALSKHLLLETASPDSLVRLTDLNDSQIMDECKKIYFEDQNHVSLCDLLQAKLFDPQGSNEGFLLHITTHGHLLSRADVNVLYHSLCLKPDQVTCFLLQEFDTEMDFSLKLKLIFRRQSGKDCLLIIQCDAGHLNIDLIACARHRVIDERVSALQMNTGTDQWVPLQATHVVFIVQLPKQAGGTKFVGFQGAQWYSVHIDDLNPPKDLSFDLPNVINHTMSEMFYTPQAVKDSDSQVFGASRRLHSLIQKAASRLHDTEKNKHRTTERIELLLDLIPLDESSDNREKKFHHILVEHISNVLQERDTIIQDSDNWVFLESVESKKLRQGGTFRNCLSKRFDEVIVPIFAEILGTIDKNYNLSLIHDAPEQSSLTAKLWLGIFANKQICTFSYNDVVLKNQKQQQHNYRIRVPGIGAILASPDYKCKFPFSWLVKDTIDSQWDNATALVAQGRNEVALDTQLYDLVASTPLGEYLNTEIFTSHPEECLDLYHSYLNDFVNSVYRTTKDDEIKLVWQALDSEVRKVAHYDDFLKKLVSIHIVYDTVKAHIQRFHHLVSVEPEIIKVLTHIVPHPANEMNLAYFAVQEILVILIPNFDHWDQYTIQNWVRRLHKVGSVIEAVLSFKTEPGSDAEELKIANRYKWQRMCVIKMFAEHIGLNFTEDEIIISVKRLWTFLAKPNFQSKATLQKIKKVMDSLDQSVRQTWKVQDPTQSKGDEEISDKHRLHVKFRLLCRSFFMEVISTLCFEPNMPNPPEDGLIMMLMDIVFAEDKSTRLLSPFNNEKVDPAPVIRSYLLQLLLTFSSTEVRALLKEYFERSDNLARQDQELYVLCIQCFEDAIYVQSSDSMSIEAKFKSALGKVIVNYDFYQSFTSMTTVITLEYLEAIASLRYGLSTIATIISECYQNDNFYDLLQQEDLNQLFNLVESLCLNGHYTQPHEFITKFIVRQFGMQFLKKLAENPVFEWLIPPHLKSKKKKNTTIDPFVLYDKVYKDVREAVAISLCGSDFAELQTALKDLTSNNSFVITLALYQQVTVQAKKITDKAMDCLIALIENCSILSIEMRYITGLLICNEQGYHLAKLRVDQRSPHYWCLRDIVIHCAVTFTHKQHENFLQPFIKLMYNPANMKGVYFPSMPDDPLFLAMNILTGKYYTCPKGHPYHIGDCGRAAVHAVCPECGATIGGASHTLVAGNHPVQMGDRTQTEHVLGTPDKRSMLPEPERSLSPSGCALLRLLLHSILVWSSCNADDSYSAELADLVHPNVPSDYLAQFFWEHLQRDMEVLSKSLNLNKDDTALIVHSILKHISQLQHYPACDASLRSKASRKRWEEEFYQGCAQPILQDIQKYHQRALDLITNDDSQEHDDLFFTIYEKLPVRTGDVQPALWRYRARITLEHLAHALQQSTNKSLALLKEFLRLEPVLRITKYLPDILYLQKLLFDQFHRRFDQGNVLNMTINDYLESLNNDHLRQVIPKLVKTFNKAWMIAKQHLVNNGRFNIPEEYVADAPIISCNTKIVYLIPTTTREGMCSTVLLDFLVTTHNEFINYYHKYYRLAEKYSNDELMKNSIPLSQLQECHLLNYESHIISVVLTHCHHSLEVGKGTDIEYDLQALEKKIVDKFIHGKPSIQFENAPRVVYRKDIHNVQMFMDIRAKIAQEKITQERRKIVLAELQSLQRLSEALDVIDIVLGFLSSGTGNPTMLFGDYVKKTLKMHVTRRTLPKAIQDCTLGNTLSLWEILSVEQAKQLTLINQEPFDKVADAYKEVLDRKAFEKLHLSLKKFPLDHLLTVLHEFIITHVSHSDEDQAKWPLKDTLLVFLERQDLPEFKELEHFPDDVLMCHVTDTWKEIVLHQNKIEK